MQIDGDRTHYTTGMTLGRYQPLQRIGRGGMGEVWLCDDPRLRRKVAIKTLPPHNPDDQAFAARFEREAQAAAKLNHPHILPVHDYGEQPLPNGQIIKYIVMPYIASGSFAHYLEHLADHRQGVPPFEAIAYLAQMAAAIDYAHDQGIVHRDIKPANMLMRSRDWLLLADFGIARALSDSRAGTQTHIGAGTPEYMAPEQAQGKAEAASDIYSLAIIAYQLFTGRLPFQADTSYATIIQHMMAPPPPPRAYNPHLSPGLENALLHGLAKDPGQRFPSARALVADLQRNLTHSLVPIDSAHPQSAQGMSTTPMAEEHSTWHNHSATPVPPSTTSPKTTITRRALIGAGAAIVVAGAGTWAIATHLHPGSQASSQSAQVTTPGPKGAVSTAPDPDGPVLTLLGHNHPVSSLAWSPQKNVLISAADDHTLKLWDVQQSQQRGIINQSTASHSFPDGSSMILAWSQDGKYIAIANAGESADFSKNFVNIYTGDLRGPAPGYEQPIQVPGMTFIEELGWLGSRYILTALSPLTNQNSIQVGLWDITQPQRMFKQTTINGEPLVSTVQPLAISPDNKYIAFPLANNLIIGTLVVNGNSVQWQQVGNTFKFDAHLPLTAKAAAWSPSSRYLIAIGDSEPSKLMGWDMKNPGQPPIPLNLPGDQTVLTALAVSPVPGTSIIAAASKDGTVYLWDVANSNVNPSRQLHSGSVKGSVTSLAWSIDGQWLAASYDDVNATILLWNTRS